MTARNGASALSMQIFMKFDPVSLELAIIFLPYDSCTLIEAVENEKAGDTASAYGGELVGAACAGDFVNQESLIKVSFEGGSRKTY